MTGQQEPSDSSHPQHSSSNQDGIQASASKKLGKEGLLQMILTETVNRRPGDTDAFYEALKRWSRDRLSHDWDRVECGHLIDQILAILFVQKKNEIASELPGEMGRQIAAALWRDPKSRMRIGRFREQLLQS